MMFSTLRLESNFLTKWPRTRKCRKSEQHNRSGMVAVLGPFWALPCYILVHTSPIVDYSTFSILSALTSTSDCPHTLVGGNWPSQMSRSKWVLNVNGENKPSYIQYTHCQNIYTVRIQCQIPGQEWWRNDRVHRLRLMCNATISCTRSHASHHFTVLCVFIFVGCLLRLLWRENLWTSAQWQISSTHKAMTSGPMWTTVVCKHSIVYAPVALIQTTKPRHWWLLGHKKLLF
jgi:hypothetical protein